MKTYFKAETTKAVQNFQITGTTVSIPLIHCIAQIKKAAATANLRLGLLEQHKAKAIIEAAEKLLSGEFDSQFPTDQLQGGAGTSINSNVNEVLSSIAEEILHDGTTVHPNDDVNMGQSTNDVIPTAIKLMLIHQIDELTSAIELVSNSCREKETEYKDIVKVARTHLQDAVPMTLGQSFGAYAAFFDRNRERLLENKKYLYTTNLGGTAIGTGINSSISFITLINKNLAKQTNQPFKSSQDLIDATQNSDDLLHIAHLVKTFAGGLSKIVNDLRLLSSGPRTGLSELLLPELQQGSTIMPGKVNPVILEMLNQICYQVFGNVESAFHAAINGQLELNVMLPVYIKNTEEAFKILSRGLIAFNEKVLKEIKPNIPQITKHFEQSLSMSTALNKVLGYDKTAELVKRTLKNKTSLLEEIRKEGLLSENEITQILSPTSLTSPADDF